jgi:hypothetical protein
MKLPRIAGTIDRRLLVNFTLEPDLASQLVPAPFRPKLIYGRAIAGICLIRLTHARPAGIPASLGAASENAAHRIAVTWDDRGREREGVFISRRDTSSRINSLLGGRIFPGMHHRAVFQVDESPPEYHVGFESDDGRAYVSVSGRVAQLLPATSIFSSIREASAFFENGPVGYSATRHEARFDGLELDTHTWHIEPLEVTDVQSSFFDTLESGTAEFDSALIMHGIEHEWHALEPICAG